MSRAIALIDVNNFYASCERVFNPKLAGKPLAILSNNDGCVIARSAELKAMGIKMGVPWFQLKETAERDGIIAMSSNYALYQDMSNRVMEIIGQFSPSQEIYSIDESWLDLTGMPTRHTEIAHTMRERIRQWTGLPVCVGIGPSKTLAKLANHTAKKKLMDDTGVCDLNELQAHELCALLDQIEIGDIWGIGRRLVPQLNQLGIHTALDLRRADPEYIRQQFSVVLEKTVRELRGHACADLEPDTPDRQQIISSRSFGQPVTDKQSLAEALSKYVSTAAEKLRRQQGYAGVISVFIHTSPFGDGAKYSGSQSVHFPSPTNDTMQMTKTALWVLDRIYSPGFRYQKAGVMLGEIVPEGGQQNDLFGFADNKTAKLMATLDQVNGKWGRDVLRLASQGYAQPWKMKQDRISPAYTTCWSDIVKTSVSQKTQEENFLFKNPLAR